MGGKEGSRGYLYQAFASVLEALCQENWDCIYIEFGSDNDKIDIALEENNKVFKSIQVKSTINTFSKSSLQKCLGDLIKDDVGSTDFELFLIGQCNQDAITFINSLKKFKSGRLDDTAKRSLNGFDTTVLEGKKIEFICIPFEIQVLEKIARDALFQYVSFKQHQLTFEQINFILSATVHDQMISATDDNKGVEKKVFDEKLEKRILLFADGYSPKRISIGIKSFICRAGNLGETTMNNLSLIDKFDGRCIRDGYDWNEDIYKKLEEFLLINTSDEKAYQIFLDTHASIAFATGRILDSKSGINVFPMQKSTPNGTVLWDVQLSSKESYSNWDISSENFNGNQGDSALLLNVSRNIYHDVVEFIKAKNLSIGRIVNCTLKEAGATNFAIKNGTHASRLANSVYEAITTRNTIERRATLHIFASAPNAFMFFLGQNSRGFGKCILYEYDFEQRNSCSYSPSMNFTK